MPKCIAPRVGEHCFIPLCVRDKNLHVCPGSRYKMSCLLWLWSKGLKNTVQYFFLFISLTNITEKWLYVIVH